MTYRVVYSIIYLDNYVCQEYDDGTLYSKTMGVFHENSTYAKQYIRPHTIKNPKRLKLVYIVGINGL